MTPKNYRYLGIGILLTLVGVIKIFTKGIYDNSDEIIWINLLVPFAMGIAVILYSLVLIFRKKSN